MNLIEQMTREHGSSARIFKSALLWSVCTNPSLIYDMARRYEAWTELDSESDSLRISDQQDQHS